MERLIRQAAAHRADSYSLGHTADAPPTTGPVSRPGSRLLDEEWIKTFAPLQLEKEPRGMVAQSADQTGNRLASHIAVPKPDPAGLTGGFGSKTLLVAVKGPGLSSPKLGSDE